MRGGIAFEPMRPEDLETVVVGEIEGVEVIVLGTRGGPEVVATTTGLVEVWKEQELMIEGAEVLIVDVSSHSIRSARLLRL